jgi:hypothetical protein
MRRHGFLKHCSASWGGRKDGENWEQLNCDLCTPTGHGRHRRVVRTVPQAIARAPSSKDRNLFSVRTSQLSATNGNSARRPPNGRAIRYRCGILFGTNCTLHWCYTSRRPSGGCPCVKLHLSPAWLFRRISGTAPADIAASTAPASTADTIAAPGSHYSSGNGG